VLRERLRREARAAATIVHPGVATIYALEEIDDQLYIAAELVTGHTLRREIERGPIDPLRTHTLAIEIARALCAAHDAGVIHRDLKPENVMITADGGVKVVDFGIADVPGSGITRLTRDGALLGTPAYMAPEQLLGAAIDARADIYAFGIVLDEMRTGRHPMSAILDGTRGQQGERGPGSTATTTGSARSVSMLLTAVVERCAQLDPAARYPTARALLADLERGPSSDASAIHGPARSSAGSTTRWWWQFHQATTALVYWLSIIAAWRARQLLGGTVGRTFFIVVLGAVVVAANLRLHLWFTSQFYPAELKWVRRRVARWIQVGDWVFAVALISAGLFIGDEGSPLAVLLLGVGAGAAVAFLVIEPATTRAAFKGSTTTDTDRTGTHRGT
jgi:hypothetical protein